MDSVEGDADQAKSGGTPKSKSITKTAARTAAAKGKGKGKDKESNGKDSYSSSSDGGGIKKSAAATKLPKSALAAAASAAGGGKSHAKRRASLEERIQMPELLSSPTPAGKPTDGATIVKEEPADDSSEYCPEETDPLLPKKIKEEDDAGDEHSDSQEDSEFDALCGEYPSSPGSDEIAQAEPQLTLCPFHRTHHLIPRIQLTPRSPGICRQISSAKANFGGLFLSRLICIMGNSVHN